MPDLKTWSDPTAPPRPMFTETGDDRGALARHVAGAFRLALSDLPVLPESVLAIPGMSGRRYRGFINSLLNRLDWPTYLEVGSWAGSTLCSALYRNPHVKAVAVDNWSEFGGPRDQFWANVDDCVTCPAVQLRVIEQDFRTVDFAQATRDPVDVFLFDGPHEEQDQRDGIVLAAPALAYRAVVIVDDWNWEQVRAGTRRGLADAGLKVLYEIQIRTTEGDLFPEVSRENSDWHNGYLIAVVERA